MSAERKRSRKSSDEGEDAQDVPQVIPDSVLLQEFVPEEVWEVVSKKVLEVGAKDHQHLFNSSQFFQNIKACQTARTTYLFEQVFPLVVKSVWKKEGLGAFPVADVLNCRAVCKEWNAVIDKVVPKFIDLGPRYRVSDAQPIYQVFYYIERNEFSWPDSGSTVYRTPGAENSVQDFMQYFEPTHDPTNPSKGRNPFIWGNVQLFFRPLRNPDDEEVVAACHRYLEDFSSLLAKYGKHVRKFHLIIHNNHVFDNPSLFREWLLLMPNLIEFSFVNKSGIKEMNDFPLQLPKLRFLEKLSIYYLPPQIFNQLLGQNNHISRLYVAPLEDDVFTVARPNLKEFKTGRSLDDVVEKLAFPQVQWPLETLELKYVRLDACDTLFQVIKDKFADTLEDLSLKITWKSADDVGGSLLRYFKKCRLDLPKLKKISLYLDESPVSLDFLLPMKKNLEEISLYYGYRAGLSQEERLEASGTTIQFSGFELKMLESNIWSIFNKLKEFEMIVHSEEFGRVPYRCYTRKDWMRKMNSTCA